MRKIIYLKPTDEYSWEMLVELAKQERKSASGLVMEAVRDILWKYEEQRRARL